MHQVGIHITALSAAVMAAVAVCSCSIDEDRLHNDTVIVNGREIPSSVFEPGTAVVLLSEELASSLELETDRSGLFKSSGVKSVDDAAASLGVTEIRPLFHCDDKYAPRKRKMGMHLWYIIEFDEKTSLTRASEELWDLKGVQNVEFTRMVTRPDYTVREVSPSSTASGDKGKAPSDIFNDPQLSRQWHYYNDGSTYNSVRGADINVLPAWESGAVGNRYAPNGTEVIVAVVDGGVDYMHEDLADNIWTGPGGIHGHNFVNGSTNVTADDHGTHVAGTVAAVNNNGIGVAGVAGGDYAAGIPGVRIMSCQIFQGESGSTDAAIASVFEWSADNGAVISQNSWSYDVSQGIPMTDTPQYMKTAIDYFTTYAGMNEDGTQQTGPMAGGLVIFAAGNDERPSGYPGSYETCLAVSAIAADYTHAYYTNYGSWVDVCAPGGDAYDGPMVLSTLPNNSYGEMQGTSMACPHVSGLAALLVSACGGDGFTSSRLRMMIETSARDISEYGISPQYMGNGLVDALAALGKMRTIAPDPVDDLEITARLNNIDYTFSVPADEDDGTPTTAKVYYSTEEFDITDSLGVEELPSATVSIKGMEVGAVVRGSISGLELNTTYYVSVATLDAMGNRSELAPILSATTDVNEYPQKYGDPDDVVLNFGGQTEDRAEIDMTEYVYDPDGDVLSYRTVFSAQNIVDVAFNGDILVLSPKAMGQTTVTITASDVLMQSVSISFDVLVRDGNRTADFYPNPVTDVLNIRTGESVTDASVTVRSAGGASLLTKEFSSITPFSPAQIDMSTLSGGMYSVVVEYTAEDGSTDSITTNIAKL